MKSFTEVGHHAVLIFRGCLTILATKRSKRDRFQKKNYFKTNLNYNKIDLKLARTCDIVLDIISQRESNIVYTANIQNMLPSQMALYHPGCFFAKSFGCESSKRFVHPCNERSSFHRKNKKYHVYQKLDF
jgi:hypothetical protein